MNGVRARRGYQPAARAPTVWQRAYVRVRLGGVCSDLRVHGPSDFAHSLLGAKDVIELGFPDPAFNRG